MVKLLIIADDFTGALDTAVQFASSGAKTRVVMDVNYHIEDIDAQVEVLVINAETRHMSSDKAYETVYKISKHANEKRIPYIFKKTDSALRGNIGSELEAVLSASGGANLHFIPALPRANRITKRGVHFIDGLPVAESVFGKDPFEPVVDSDIKRIIQIQSDAKVIIVENNDFEFECEGGAIVVYDVETDEDIYEIVDRLDKKDQLRLMAGCAGLASVLPRLLGLAGDKKDTYGLADKFLVACGSVNPITRAQLDYAEKNGFERIRLTPEQKLNDSYFKTDIGLKEFDKLRTLCMTHQKCIIDSNDLLGESATQAYMEKYSLSLEDARQKIASNIGRIVKMLFESGLESTVMLTGGDTLMGFMNHMNATEITPLYEMAPGTVFSQLTIEDKNIEILTKSGGFGDEQLLVSLAENLTELKKEERIC